MSYDAMNTLPLYLVACVLDQGEEEWKAVWRCVCKSWAHHLATHVTCANVHIHSVPLLTWALDHGYVGSSVTTTMAAQFGPLDVVKLCDSRWSWYNDPIAYYRAAINGRVDVMKILKDHSTHTYYRTFYRAAYRGHLDVLQLLTRANGVDTTILYGAAKGGHKHILQWAYDRGANFDSYVSTKAAQGGHLDVLQWLHDHYCPMDELTYCAGVATGSLEMVKFLRGCPFSIQAVSLAASRGFLDIVQYFFDTYDIFDRAFVYANAKRSDQTHVTQWLDEIQ